MFFRLILYADSEHPTKATVYDLNKCKLNRQFRLLSLISTLSSHSFKLSCPYNTPSNRSSGQIKAPISYGLRTNHKKNTI